MLIDDSSASASEMLAAALHDNKRALLCGSKSFGKGVMQIFYPLPNSTALSITAGRYLTPSGRWLGSGNYGDEVSQVENGQKEKKEREKETKKESAHGLEPDILIEPKPEIEYGADDDNQLQSCLKLAQAKLTSQNQKVSENKGAKQEDQGAR
ncbi:MAG: putative CtpA-like serine protease [bacterium ADurb.Bin425]|nr:MAG: putative CtpA-like serine protease [bacterium ADurb.Bin425]